MRHESNVQSALNKTALILVVVAFSFFSFQVVRACSTTYGSVYSIVATK